MARNYRAIPLSQPGAAMSRREFRLTEGSSNKFWAITIEEEKFTVEFGRIGTKGKSQEKKLDRKEKAREAADKLIAEKTKKGYTEVGTTTVPSPSPKSAAKKSKAKPVVEPATSPPPPAPATLVVTRTIDLDREDWHRATWRPCRRPEGGVRIPYDSRFKKLTDLARENVRAEDVLSVLDDRLLKEYWLSVNVDVLTWASCHLFPYLSDTVLDDLRALLRPLLKQSQWPTDYYRRPTMTFFLAALSGLYPEVQALVESWPDDLYGRQYWDDHYHMPQQMVFGLGDAHLVDRHMRRLKLRCATVTISAHGWLTPN